MNERYEKLLSRAKAIGWSLVPIDTMSSNVLKHYLDTQEKEIDRVYQEKYIFPTRTVVKGDCNRRIISSRWGLDTKHKIRTIGKKLPLYGQKIVCPIMGEADSTTKIPINNIGRWLFGTPGYKSNIRFRAVEGTNMYEIQWSADAPEIVTKLVDEIISIWETSEEGVL
jgi:hypothetical protein